MSCFAPCSEESNECIVFVALAIVLSHSCPVVASDALTTSIYSGKLTVAKTGALEATEPTNNTKCSQLNIMMLRSVNLQEKETAEKEKQGEELTAKNIIRFMHTKNT